MSELSPRDFDNNAPTDADLWLELYDKFGSIMTARTESGHLENVIDVLIDRLENAEKATTERIIKLLQKKLFHTVYNNGEYPPVVNQQHFGGDIIALIKGENK